ncbi:hypothetical protein AVEN_201405-1, partial [Araneus ventricosus]
AYIDDKELNGTFVVNQVLSIFGKQMDSQNILGCVSEAVPLQPLNLQVNQTTVYSKASPKGPPPPRSKYLMLGNMSP